MKLSYDQLHLLGRLAKEKGPVTPDTLRNKGGLYLPTLEALVRKQLVRIRVTPGRTDRYQILAAGHQLLKTHPAAARKYS